MDVALFEISPQAKTQLKFRSKSNDIGSEFICWHSGLAGRCGHLNLTFLRKKGLIHSWRNQGNQRRYRRDVLRRIAVFKAAQKMGITREEIKETLSTLPDKRTPTKADWQQLAQHWQRQLDEKIAYMQRLRDRVDGCVGCGCLSMENCPIYCPIYNADDYLGEHDSGAVLLEHPELERSGD